MLTKAVFRFRVIPRHSWLKIPESTLVREIEIYLKIKTNKQTKNTGKQILFLIIFSFSPKQQTFGAKELFKIFKSIHIHFNGHRNHDSNTWKWTSLRKDNEKK